MTDMDGNGNWCGDGPHVEIVRVARLCHPDWEGLSQLTFSPVSANPVWQIWRDEIFLPILLPGLQSMRNAGAACNRDDLLAADKSLDDLLPGEMAARSRRAGQKLLGAFPAPPAEKFWRHYGGLVERGGAPGHLCAVLAVRASAFHVASGLLSAACIFLEARAGLGEKGVAQWMEMTDDCIRAGAKQKTTTLRAA